MHQNLPSLVLPLNLRSLTPILKSRWTTFYYLLKRHPAYWEWLSIITSNSMHLHMSNLQSPGLHAISSSLRPLRVLTRVRKRKPYPSPICPLSRLFSIYAPPIWFPNATPSLTQKLQDIQKSALRITHGCVKMTSIKQFYEETKSFLSKTTFP